MAAYWNVEKGVVLCDSVDISIAVATEKVCCTIYCFKVVGSIGSKLYFILLQGLMTPIVRNADQKSISAISNEVLLGLFCFHFEDLFTSS